MAREYNPVQRAYIEGYLLEAAQSPSVLQPAATRPLPPLCVDLDGTLVKSDTLFDSLLLLVRRRPFDALLLPFWLARGKAGFKSAVAERVELSAALNVAHLPFNRPLVEFLLAERAIGRELYLATGANQRTARRVAAHFGIFIDVLCSDGQTNLTGARKLDAFTQRFAGNFDYIGNSAADFPVLRAAQSPMVANPSRALKSKLRAARITPAHTFIDRRSRFISFIKAIRVHQWAKNALIFLPILLAHDVHHQVPWVLALLAFESFCFAASSAYIFNDLLDLESDRAHPRKSLRPFASANLSPATGIVAALVLLAFAILLATRLPAAFGFWLAVYYATTVAYSLALKRVVLIDVLVLSGLYTFRILAGAAATSVPISPWLGAFSIFFFLSLAMAKRFAELANLRAQDKAPAYGRGYILADIEQIRSFGTAAAYGAVIIFILYINNSAVTALYSHPQRMWLMAPLMIWWTSRVWMLASRGELNEDPLIFALTDKISLGIGALVFVVALLAV